MRCFVLPSKAGSRPCCFCLRSTGHRRLVVPAATGFGSRTKQASGGSNARGRKGGMSPETRAEVDAEIAAQNLLVQQSLAADIASRARNSTTNMPDFRADLDQAAQEEMLRMHAGVLDQVLADTAASSYNSTTSSSSSSSSTSPTSSSTGLQSDSNSNSGVSNAEVLLTGGAVLLTAGGVAAGPGSSASKVSATPAASHQHPSPGAVAANGHSPSFSSGQEAAASSSTGSPGTNSSGWPAGLHLEDFLLGDDIIEQLALLEQQEAAALNSANETDAAAAADELVSTSPPLQATEGALFSSGPASASSPDTAASAAASQSLNGRRAQRRGTRIKLPHLETDARAPEFREKWARARGVDQDGAFQQQPDNSSSSSRSDQLSGTTSSNSSLSPATATRPSAYKSPTSSAFPSDGAADPQPSTTPVGAAHASPSSKPFAATSPLPTQLQASAASDATVSTARSSLTSPSSTAAAAEQQATADGHTLLGLMVDDAAAASVARWRRTQVTSVIEWAEREAELERQLAESRAQLATLARAYEAPSQEAEKVKTQTFTSDLQKAQERIASLEAAGETAKQRLLATERGRDAEREAVRKLREELQLMGMQLAVASEQAQAAREEVDELRAQAAATAPAADGAPGGFGAVDGGKAMAVTGLVTSMLTRVVAAPGMRAEDKVALTRSLNEILTTLLG